MPLDLKKRKIHFIGIGGVGMSGIAELLHQQGHVISGSDLSVGEIFKRLEKLGIACKDTHSPEHITHYKPDVVVYSSAIKKSNEEFQKALELHVPVISRAEMLAEAMRMKRGVAIAGSHGKTTTTGMVTEIIKKTALDPTVVIGGRFASIGSSTSSLGKGEWFLAEADESDGSFLKLSPEISVVTNIDKEHCDFYASDEALNDAFIEFINKTPFYGKVILNSDCQRIFSLKERINKPTTYFGFEKEKNPDCLISIQKNQGVSEFSLHSKKDSPLNKAAFSVSVPGKHNILNATAAILVAHEMNVPVAEIQNLIKNFKGVSRRFEVKGEWKERIVVEDYAHHPTEIRSTIEAATSCFQEKPVVIFQPHRYSRTIHLWNEFKNSFQGAEKVFFLPVFPGSEKKEDWNYYDDQYDFQKHCTGIASTNCSGFDDCYEKLLSYEGEGSNKASILILGAGNTHQMTTRLC